MPRLGLRLALVSALILILTTTGCISINLFEGGRAPLQETRVSGSASASDKILMIQISGVIQDQTLGGGLFGIDSEGTVARVREELDAASLDDKVKALLIRVDSPGGSATASDLVFQEITRFKKERGIPVVAQFMGTAASGGYYIAMAADEILALPTSITGSIGVIYSGVSVAGLMEKLGVYDQTITSGDFKGTGSPLQRMRPEQRAQMQSVIDALYARFVDVVEEGRPNLDEAKILKLADGRIYSAPQALDAGLIDEIGSPQDAVVRAMSLANLREAQVVTYHRPNEYRQNLYTRAGGQPGLQIDLASLLGIQPAGPGFFYLWMPPLR
jgi:protease-4